MSEWRIENLGSISIQIQTGPFGSQLHQSDYSDIGTPVIMPKDIVDGKISDDSIARVEEAHVNRLARHKVNEGDIIYPRRGDVRKCAYTTAKQIGWLCGTGCLRVTIDNKKAVPKYVFYHLQEDKTRGWIEKHAIGATMLNINTSILSNIPLRIPSLDVQKKISTTLSRYDSLIDNYQRQIKLLEEAAQRLYKEWFVNLRFPGHENTKIVDGVPEGWEKKKLEDIVFENGKRITKKNRDSYECYIPIDCLPQKQLSYINFNSVEQAESSLIAFSCRDIIFGAMRPYFHKVCVARHLGITRSTCFVLQAKESEYSAFATMLLFDEKTIKYASSISVGTTMPYTRWKDFKKMEIMVPHIEIARIFNAKISKILSTCGRLADQIIHLTESRDRLLPKLLSGEIEV